METRLKGYLNTGIMSHVVFLIYMAMDVYTS